MPDPTSYSIPVADLRIGLYIHLDLGWMDHPFPLSSFKITSEQQIATLRGLGLASVRYAPDKSDPPPTVEVPTQQHPEPPAQEATVPLAEADPLKAQRAALLSAQRLAENQCERQYQASARAVKAVFEQHHAMPQQAGLACSHLISDMVHRLHGHEESALRLLGEGHGDRATGHALNVTVLSLLLGQALQLDAASLGILGQAAMVHDIGKSELPERVRFRDESFTPTHFKLYQEHVSHSVLKARQMGLPPAALLAISQHHEMADGTGFPLGLKVDKMSPVARILALINRYDGLCNPPNPLKALTPHEALSLIFSSMKERFDKVTLNAFIRLMGVYPPGSVVQLTDERYALVMSVNASRPLKPRILVHDSAVASEDAIFLDLQTANALGIQRSLRPDQLPRHALNYLCPRQRICYYFERAVTDCTSTEMPA
jgi:HD-GYP domain-containing protein (c-di-GMP phosphodiesterase class II)